MMRIWLAVLALAMGMAVCGRTLGAEDAARKIPVILTTDIGDDIDDTWALGFMLRCPELDVKLVVGDYGNVDYRVKLLAKFLQQVGRTDIPVGKGVGPSTKDKRNQSAWVDDYDPKTYPGKIHDDGIAAMIDVIMNSPDKVTVIAIGPMPNVAALLQREPKVVQKARFVGMHGSVRVGYGGGKQPSAEWNVKADVKSCQTVFVAPWDMTITPLDTCGLVHLTGDKYRKVLESNDPIARTIIENYRIWTAAIKNDALGQRRSTTLYDCVAIYLAFSQDLTTIEQLGIRVTDDGMTVIDPQAKTINVATRWKDMGAFEDLLVKRITGQ